VFTKNDISNVSQNYSGLRYMTPHEREVAAQLHSVNFYVAEVLESENFYSYKEYNSYGDFHLIPETMPFIVPPPLKLLTVDVPGSTTGEVDMSESLTGAPLYGVREGTLEFMYENTYRHATQMHEGENGTYAPNWPVQKTQAGAAGVHEKVRGGNGRPSFIGDEGQLLNNDPYLPVPGATGNSYTPAVNDRYFYKDGYQTPFEIYKNLMDTIHGRRVRIVLMDNPDYYYEGRVWIEAMTPGQQSAGKVSIKYRLSPYRYQVARGAEGSSQGTTHGMVTYGTVPIFHPRTNYPGYVYIINKMTGGQNPKPIAIL
jgi:hypothetical protein